MKGILKYEAKIPIWLIVLSIAASYAAMMLYNYKAVLDAYNSGTEYIASNSDYTYMGAILALLLMLTYALVDKFIISKRKTIEMIENEIIASKE